MPDNINDYDSEPVEYCARCYSLKILHDDTTDTDICSVCGNTDMATTTIDKWERLYEGRYGHSFISKSNNPKDSIWFKMPVSELKTKLFYSKYLRAIIYDLYHSFPEGLSKSDSIILLFDKLSKDNRMDDLRYTLYNYSKRG